MAGKNQFEDPYERLANAIILSAVADYRAALKKVKRNPKSKAAIDEALQIEKFFRSSWYQQLTSVAGIRWCTIRCTMHLRDMELKMM